MPQSQVLHVLVEALRFGNTVLNYRRCDYAYRYLRIFGDDAARSMATLASATSPAALRERLEALAGTGCDEAILVATTSDTGDLQRAIDVVAR